MSLAAEAAADVPRDDGAASPARERRTTFLLAVAGAAVIVGAAGLLARRRSRGRALAEKAARTASLPAAAAKVSADSPHKPGEDPAVFTKICPACGRRYPAAMVLCADDRQALVILN